MKLLIFFTLCSSVSFAQPGPDVWLGSSIEFNIGKRDSNGDFQLLDSLELEIDDSSTTLPQQPTIYLKNENALAFLDPRFDNRDQNYIVVNGHYRNCKVLPGIYRFKSGETVMEVKAPKLSSLTLELKPGKYEFPENYSEMICFQNLSNVTNAGQENFKVTRWGENKTVLLNSEAIKLLPNPKLKNRRMIAGCSDQKGGNYFFTRTDQLYMDIGKLEFWESKWTGDSMVYVKISVVSDSAYQGYNFGTIHFKDSLHGWLFSRSGMISDRYHFVYETSDGGLHWKFSEKLSQRGFFAVQSANKTTYVFKLNDKYKVELYSLKNLSKPLSTCVDSNYYKALDVFNSQEQFGKITGAFQYSEKENVLTSSDYSKSTCAVNETTAFRLNKDKKVVQKTVDSGVTWTDLLPLGSLDRVVFRNEKSGVLLSNNLMLLTFDGGATWTAKLIPKKDEIRFNLGEYSSYIYPTYISWMGDKLFIQDYYLGLISIDLRGVN